MGWVILIIGVVGFVIWLRKKDKEFDEQTKKEIEMRRMEDERQNLWRQGEECFNSGETHLEKGNIDQAIADFNKAIRIVPGYTIAYEKCAEAYAKKGDTIRAAEYYQKCQELRKAAQRFREASERYERLKYS